MEPTAGLPPLLHAEMQVYVVPPLLKGPRCLRVAEVSGDASQLVLFEDVAERDVAEELAGHFLLVREADLPDDFAMADVPALIGRTVHDAELGPLGAIEEVMRGPAQDVWVVRGAFGEVLIPAVDEIVLDISGTGDIEVRVPAGSVDMGERA